MHANTPCCNFPHPFETHHVSTRWTPTPLRCLIIGESPGNPGADYFYDPIPAAGRDPVAVRARLLPALTQSGLINEPTLEAFRNAGFLFDHAVRCQIPMEQVNADRNRAQRFRGLLVQKPDHLRPLIAKAERVWVMGLLARNAVANLFPDIAWERKPLTPPYRVEEMKKVVVSRYFTRMGEKGAGEIAKQVAKLLKRNAAN